MRAVLARDAGEESEVAWRWLELLPGALAAAREASEALPDEGGGTRVVCHGDLWPAHTWFDREAFVGFTDLESLTFASPALNLAQLVTHVPGAHRANLRSLLVSLVQATGDVKRSRI